MVFVKLFVLFVLILSFKIVLGVIFGLSNLYIASLTSAFLLGFLVEAKVIKERLLEGAFQKCGKVKSIFGLYFMFLSFLVLYMLLFSKDGFSELPGIVTLVWSFILLIGFFVGHYLVVKALEREKAKSR